MAVFADLERLIGPPELPSLHVDWATLEAVTELPFPSDYKKLFDAYRDLHFDGFLGVFHPGADPVEYRQGANGILESLRSLIESRGFGRVEDDGRIVEGVFLPIYPDLGGLLSWGSTDNGDQCLWRTASDDPDLWTVVVTDEVDFWEFQGTMTDFLVGIMDGSVHCPIFPDDFPSSVQVRQTAF